jgi:molybdopterin-containing oxidoreductase family membrane subunit
MIESLKRPEPPVTGADGNGHSHPHPEAPPLRPPVLASPKTVGQVTREIVQHTERRPGRAWWAAFGVAAAVFAVGAVAMWQAMAVGMGVWGLNRTVGWGLDITNFVYWIEIAHAGTMISAVLFLFRQQWRTSISRAAEAMTIFALACAGILPLIHMGRPWYFYWLMPYPNDRGTLWVNFRSPLLWDFFAINTYLIISVTFWYIGMIPDLATLRDRSKPGLKRTILSLVTHGWNGSAHVWHRYEKIYGMLALLATLLVVSVCSIVSFDFATSVIPGWHSTIFPPYFLMGAFFCGFAMLLGVLVVARKLMRLEEYITPYHLNWMCKVLLVTSAIVTCIYGIELFVAWYSGNPYEIALFRNRATGPYAWALWTVLVCNVVAPQILWSRRARRTPWLIFLVCVIINIGMWFERFVITVTSLHRDYLPSSWTIYTPTANEIAILLGMFGLFFAAFMLFTRILPVIPMSEVKAELAHAHPGPSAGQNEEATYRLNTKTRRTSTHSRQQRAGTRSHKGGLEKGPLPSGVPLFQSLCGAGYPLAAVASGCMSFVSLCSSGFRVFAPFALSRQEKTASDRFCIGYFESERDLLDATWEARLRGYHVLDAFAPYAVKGLSEALGLKPSRLGWIAFWAGAIALTLSLTMQSWVSARDWPLRVGGQPFNTWPIWIPVTVELTVLFAGLIGVAALFVRTQMWPGKKTPVLRGVTDNRFALALRETDAAIDLQEMIAMLRQYRASEVVEGDELE